MWYALLLLLTSLYNIIKMAMINRCLRSPFNCSLTITVAFMGVEQMWAGYSMKMSLKGLRFQAITYVNSICGK